MELHTIDVWPGKAYPLGAHLDGGGCNFSVYSEAADKVELCLFDAAGIEERVTLPENTGNVWHCYLPGVRAGQLYGYRVHGPFAPAEGVRCNPNKLLIDPYARAIEGRVDWHPSVYDYQLDQVDTPNEEDSAEHVPRSVVIDSRFDWQGDTAPDAPWHKTVIYELHTKGFTKNHPALPEELRGTYAGLAHPATTRYLQELGITAIELMPIHHFVHDQRLINLGLRNYWGYNTIGYFAPHDEYRSDPTPGSQVNDFKAMIRAMHAAGIEVILDVVYNHTAEGGVGGPTLCFRGFDNAAYYRLAPNDKSRYVDYTGCGNTMNMQQPHVIQLLMDSLRYWVLEMHVDGFRFDLAAALARGLHDVDRLGVFFTLIQQDPVLQSVKLIAEPWDIGQGGYQVGGFPPQWSEWNGMYRDTTRDFWRGTDQTLAEFAYRLTGSSDLYESSSRRPHASINFITSHDGFTLRDLVSYDHRHNLANGEDNRDGDAHNRSWNCGVEGPTDDPDVLALRARQQRNFFATLLLSQGVPMILAGDEISRSQGGNNNPYCQDNPISWTDWSTADSQLLDFVRGLMRFRDAHPVLRRRRWFEGRSIRGDDVHHDIGWFRPDGTEMSDEDWRMSFAKALGVFLNGNGIASPGPQGETVIDCSFFIIFNASESTVQFSLPQDLDATQWAKRIDTEIGLVCAVEDAELISPDTIIPVCGRAMLVLQAR